MTKIDTPQDLAANALETFAGDVTPLSRGLSHAALRHLEYYLTRHFSGGGPLHTLETGAGASTILFSRYSARHVAHIGDGQAGDALRTRLQSCKDYSAHAVSFATKAFSPVREGSAPAADLDVILINGSRMYPVPEIELMAACQRLKPTGILVIGGLDIPTVHRLFEVVRQDDMYFVNDVVEGTAFLTRTASPVPDFNSDAWFEQAFNAQNHPALVWPEFTINATLPLETRFTGRLLRLPPWFERGFSLIEGAPATDAAFSMIRIPLGSPVSGPITLSLEFDVVAADLRGYAELEVKINGRDGGQHALGGKTRRTLEFRVDLDQSDSLLIHLTNIGAVRADELSREIPGVPSKRRPNIILRRLAVRSVDADPQQQKRHFESVEGAVVTFPFDGQTFRFLVDDPHDSIQAHHNVGELYEVEELRLLARHVPREANILDVGSNIGNHAVYFEKVMGAKSIVLVEMQPRVIELLRINCALNGLRTIDEGCLGVAFGREDATGNVFVPQSFNVAGGQIQQSDDGSIPIRIGDHMVGDREIDFIKIDVEGAEIDVIAGLSATIARCEPLLFVEVWDKNREAFDALMAKLGYQSVEEFRRYDIATNLLLEPKSGARDRMRRKVRRLDVPIRRWLPWTRS